MAPNTQNRILSQSICPIILGKSVGENKREKFLGFYWIFRDKMHALEKVKLYSDCLKKVKLKKPPFDSEDLSLFNVQLMQLMHLCDNVTISSNGKKSE